MIDKNEKQCQGGNCQVERLFAQHINTLTISARIKFGILNEMRLDDFSHLEIWQNNSG